MEVEKEIGVLLLARGLTLATAESCTGGLLGHRITNSPGSSAYYLGGFVTYADELKEALLGVRHETLLAHGSVSEETAREMARGACQRTGADVAIGITGIAGPAGGTPEKPVGLVYVALSAPGTEQCRRYIWQGDRLANKEQSVEVALQLLLTHLKAPGTGRGMPQFMDEPVSVELLADQEGSPRPLAFQWHGRRFRIESWGRESIGSRDGRAVRCLLVQTAGPQTWELCQDMETAQWRLTRRWAPEQHRV